jgi:hypothetical protein
MTVGEWIFVIIVNLALIVGGGWTAWLLLKFVVRWTLVLVAVVFGLAGSAWRGEL